MKIKLLMVVSVVALLICGGLPPAAQAAPVLDFSLGPGPSTAEVYYDGGGLVGTGIQVTGLTVTGAPMDNGYYPITNGILSFQTGSYTGSTTSPIAAWLFSGGGTVTVTGAIPGLSIPSETLLSGYFNTAFVTYSGSQVGLAGGLVSIDGAQTTFTDTKAYNLVTDLGLTSTTGWAGAFNLSFYDNDNTSPSSSPNYFDTSAQDEELQNGYVGSGNLTNVPLPPSALLLGSGLLGLAGLGWRRGRKS